MPKGRALYIWALVALTLGHLAYRQLREPALTDVTIRDTPFAIGEVTLGLGGESPDWGPCQLLIFFRPDCPFCNRAASAERDRSDLVLPRTWITETEVEALQFADRPSPRSSTVWSPDANREFGVRGVPVAFLIEGGRAVNYWIYKGDESDQELAASCSAGATRS